MTLLLKWKIITTLQTEDMSNSEAFQIKIDNSSMFLL